jgi:hypothetical protein
VLLQEGPGAGLEKENNPNVQEWQKIRNGKRSGMEKGAGMMQKIRNDAEDQK